MDKYKILAEKLEKISRHIEEMDVKGEKAAEYLIRYKKGVDERIEYVRERRVRDSHGALMGLIRGLSDWDELCADKELRQLAHDADVYYKKECYTFDD